MYEKLVLINFFDFKNAFDSVHRESLWRIMERLYGISSKIIDIRSFHDGCRCAVRYEGEVGEWFQIVTGVCIVTNDFCPDSGLGDGEGC